MRLHTIKEKDGIRCFLHGNKDSYDEIVSWEFYPFKREFGISLDLNADSERTISFMLKIPFLFALYVTFDRKFGYSNWWRKLLRLDEDRKYDGRRFGITWNKSDFPETRSGTWRLSLGEYENCWNSTDPKWLSMSFTPSELIYGKIKYSDDNIIEVVERDITIPEGHGYPEKTYKCKCKIFESKWEFQRFKKPYTMLRSEVSSEEGIPHPGKGTCDYNCGEDHFSSITSPESNIDFAFEKFRNQAIWYRKHYPL